MPTAVPGSSSAPVTSDSTIANVAITHELHDAEQADPGDLAGQQLARPDRRQQDLDHARGLLLDHAGRDPDAVAEELPVERAAPR